MSGDVPKNALIGGHASAAPDLLGFGASGGQQRLQRSFTAVGERQLDHLRVKELLLSAAGQCRGSLCCGSRPL